MHFSEVIIVITTKQSANITHRSNMQLRSSITLIVCFTVLSFAAEECSQYNIDPAVLEVPAPDIDTKSGIALVFKNLHGRLNARRVVNPKTGIPCYEWECQSFERRGETCRWCLPSVFVGGFSKCGTTALCDKLESHPSIRVYRKKEINIFSKMSYNLSLFEHKVEQTIDHDFYNYRLHRMAREGTTRNTTHEKEVDNKKGDFWMDCTAGAFRDFNAAAHLLKYSPATKIIMIVRDPWQNMGSRISQQIRHGRAPKRKISELTREFKRLQLPPSERFTAKSISKVASGTDYAYAEKLLYWRAAFPAASSMLVLDQYDLQRYPNTTMHRIEEFLSLPHFAYSDSVLRSVSHNANTMSSFALNISSSAVMRATGSRHSRRRNSEGSNIRAAHESPGDNDDEKEAGEVGVKAASSSSGSSSSGSSGGEGVEIHRPYSFADKPVLFRLSKGVFEPSLCLFERVFGWKIRITTESEL